MNLEKSNKLYFYALIFVAATLCFPTINAINNIGIIIFVLLWIIEGRWTEKWNAITQSKIAILAAGFFGIHLVGLFNTENITQGLGVLLDYLPFCLFPLVLSSITPLNQRQVFIIISVFVLSCFVATFICVGNCIQIASSVDRLEYNGNEYWFYSLFTRPIHINPIYLSLYVGFCVFFIGAYLFNSAKHLVFIEKLVLILAALYFTTILCLLATRTALVSTLALCLVNYILYVYKTKKGVWYMVPAFLFVIGIISIISTSSFLKKRFVDIKNFSDKGIEENIQTRQVVHKSWKGASVRLAIWKASIDVIEDNFLTGVGTGDTQDELVKAYKNNSYIFEKGETRHNAHNQFIQTQVTSGIIGLVVLVAIFILCLYKGWQENSYFYITFIIYVIINCQTEALLQRPKGIVFFSMISFLLFFSFDYKSYFQRKELLALKYV
jgi:O-antigen ligase